MSHKPTVPAEPPAAPLTEQEAVQAIGAHEAALRELEEQHGQATTLSTAEPLEREIGVAQGRLRRARGELLAAQQRRARAEADTRVAAQRPHHERLLQLADDEVPAAATAFRDALTALIEKGTMLANVFTAVRR